MWSSVEVSPAPAGAPCGRGKHSATLLGGHVYVLGGRGAGGALPLKDFWKYSLADGTWEKLPCHGDAPPSLQEHTAIARGQCLYVFGGEAGTHSTETPLWIYNTETGTWRKLSGGGAGRAAETTLRARGARGAGGAGGAVAAAGAGAPSGRRGHTAHALSDCMLIYGGYKDLRGSTNELWAFHYESETWRCVRTAEAAAGPARHRHAAALHGSRLYVHGGMCDLQPSAQLWRLELGAAAARFWRWSCLRPRPAPPALSGHAARRAGAHMYVFGGDAAGRPCSHLWRFHFATETWERVQETATWPSARVDACALLVRHLPPRARAPAPAALAPRAPASAAAPACAPARPPRLQWSMKRHSRCSYSVLAAGDPEGELEGEDEEGGALHAISKSHSAYIIDKSIEHMEPREADEAEFRCEVPHEPLSVPSLAPLAAPRAPLSAPRAPLAAPRAPLAPLAAHGPQPPTKLVYLDSDEERDHMTTFDGDSGGGKIDISGKGERVVVAIPKSASVRFTKEKEVPTTEDESEMSTSDYASAERVNRLSGTSIGFCNPHYLGPDVRKLGATLTPDSGFGTGDIELQDLSEKRQIQNEVKSNPELYLLLVGGKEIPHAALLQRPISMWSYRLL